MGGVIIVDSSEEEEEERKEEDKEVEKIIKKGQKAKRKILTGVSDEVKISTSIILNICILYVELMIFFIVAVRKVAAGHKLVTQGHAAVAEGWQLFEEAVEEAGPGTCQTFGGN